MSKRTKKATPVVGESAASEPQAANPRIIHETMQHEVIAVELIDPSPFQPRKDFPKAEIEELAETIAANGQLVPGCVRTKAGGRYELVAGERRLRAVKLAGLKFFRAEVRELSNAAVRQMIMIEGIQRKDFNAIEQARALKRMLDAGDARTQEELAGRLKIEQGTLSNRLRLLELPPAWQAKIISREITERHARAVLPYVAYPRVMDVVLKGLEAEIKRNGGPPPCDEWENDELPRLLYNDRATRPLAGTDYDFKSFQYVPRFTPTEDQRKELGIIAVHRGRAGGKEEFATNIKLWDKLQAEFKKEYLRRHEAKNKPAKAKTDKPLTPAEVRQREKQRAEQFGRRLAELVTNVKRWAIAEELRSGGNTNVLDLIKLLLCCIGEWRTFADRDLSRNFGDGLEPGRSKCAFWKALAELADPETGEAAATFAAKCFHGEDGPNMLVGADQVAAIFDYFAMSIERIWEEKYLGPYTEAYFNLHGKEALVTLMQELAIDGSSSEPKSDLLGACMAASNEKRLAFPAELRERVPQKKSKSKSKKK